MTKKLYLKLKSGGIHTLGLDVTWQNAGFLFAEFENLGVFDKVDCALEDGKQGRLVISALNNQDRNVIGEHEFVSLVFVWDENTRHEKVVFDTDNLIARDSDGNAIEVFCLTADYTPDPNVIEFIWR